MHFRSFPQLTILFRALIVITTCITFGALQQTAFAKPSSCPSASALCNSQSEPGWSDGPPIGRSTLKGMSGLAGPDVTDPSHNYFYAGASQIFTADGAVGDFEQDAPRLGQFTGRTGEHSLAELAVESAALSQVVEVGWIVDPILNRDGRPHLFVHYWVNGVAGGYNTNFVHEPNTPQPGQKLPVDGHTHLYAIYFFQGNWWIGYFQGTLWKNAYRPFTQTSYTLWFGEVAEPLSEPYPCSTQMGNGLFGHRDGSAVINTTRFIVNGKVASTSVGTFESDPSVYDTGHSTSDSFTYGGPGDTSKTDCP